LKQSGNCECPDERREGSIMSQARSDEVLGRESLGLGLEVGVCVLSALAFFGVAVALATKHVQDLRHQMRRLYE